MAKQGEESLLRRVDRLEKELEQLKRDLLQQLAVSGSLRPARKPTLYGSVRGGDVTDQIIEKSKKKVFRSYEDL